MGAKEKRSKMKIFRILGAPIIYSGTVEYTVSGSSRISTLV